MSCPHAYLPYKAPAAYDDLAQLYLPCPIHDRLGYQRALAVIEWLAPRVQGPDQRAFLSTVRELVRDYELRDGLYQAASGGAT